MSDTDSSPPSDMDLLVGIGAELELEVQTVIVDMVFYGVYVVLCCVSLHSILQRPKKSYRTLILVTLLLFTFILVTLICASDITILLREIRSVLMGSGTSLGDTAVGDTDTPGTGEDGDVLSSPLSDRWNAFYGNGVFTFQGRLQIIVEGIGDSGTLFMINDALAAWRASTIWQARNSRLLPCILYFLVFSTFAIWIPYTVLDFRGFKDGVFTPWQVPTNLATAGSVLSILSNGLATAMIGFMARRHLRVEAESGLRFTGARILTVLAESGVIYVVLQIVRLGLALTASYANVFYNDQIYNANSLFISCTLIVTAMYTPTVIIIIYYGYSLSDSLNNNSSDRTRTVIIHQYNTHHHDDPEKNGINSSSVRRIDGITFRKPPQTTMDTNTGTGIGTIDVGIPTRSVVLNTTSMGSRESAEETDLRIAPSHESADTRQGDNQPRGKA